MAPRAPRVTWGGGPCAAGERSAAAGAASAGGRRLPRPLRQHPTRRALRRPWPPAGGPWATAAWCSGCTQPSPPGARPRPYPSRRERPAGPCRPPTVWSAVMTRGHSSRRTPTAPREAHKVWDRRPLGECHLCTCRSGWQACACTPLAQLPALPAVSFSPPCRSAVHR